MTFGEAPVGSIVVVIDTMTDGTKERSDRCYEKLHEERWGNARRLFADFRCDVHPTIEVEIVDPATIQRS